MTKAEFIQELRNMADALEANSFYVIDLPGGHTIFANRNYGEVWTKIGTGASISTNLFAATEDEKKAAMEAE